MLSRWVMTLAACKPNPNAATDALDSRYPGSHEVCHMLVHRMHECCNPTVARRSTRVPVELDIPDHANIWAKRLNVPLSHNLQPNQRDIRKPIGSVALGLM